MAQRIGALPAPDLVNTVASVVARNAAANPDGFAFVEATAGTAMTWGEYDGRSARIAGALLEQHAAGERIALQIADGPGVHAAMLGCEKAGLVAVGIGARAGARERDHIVARTGARTLITGDPRESEPGAGRPLGPEELWFLNSTSGTTGLPKIVMHNQARWFAFHELADRVAHFSADDVFCSALPAPFGFGLWTAHFTPAIAGAPCVVLERFSADALLAAIERYRVTVLAAVSTQFVMMLNSPRLGAHDLSSLRVLFTGGEMVPYERAKEFEDRTGAYVLQFYGSNETGALSNTAPDDPQEKRLRTAGRIIPEMHVRLLDRYRCRRPRACRRARAPRYVSATGTMTSRTTSCSPTTAGCAWATSRRSTTTAISLWSAARPTSSSAAARTSAPRRSRTRSRAIPRSRCAAAVAMPDPTFGERVCVFVELRDGHDALSLDDLLAHLDARGTGKELWPERLVVLDALPRASGGKVAKGELRARAVSFNLRG